MKKLVLFLILLFFVIKVYTADFDLRIIEADVGRIVVGIPRQLNGGTNFSIFLNGKEVLNTNWLNSSIDAKSITTTVKYSTNLSATEILYMYAKENFGPASYVSATVTLTAKPQNQIITLDRDSIVYDNRNYFNAWNIYGVEPDFIVNTTFPYGLYLTEIIVSGNENATVALEIDDKVVRYYSFPAYGTSGQIFSTKLFIAPGKSFAVGLVEGVEGYYYVSISGEIVK